jgi:hypothetical protein
VCTSLVRDVDAVDLCICMVESSAILLLPTLDKAVALWNAAVARTNPLHLLGMEWQDVIGAVMLCVVASITTAFCITSVPGADASVCVR